MNKKNLLDKMSLIDIDYVEAAAYPKVHKSNTIRRPIVRKATVAAAAIFCIFVGYTCFKPQTTAVADKPFYEHTVSFEDYQIKEKMDVVKVKDVPSETWEKKYNTLEEIENLLGIKLLKSSKNYDAPVPSDSDVEDVLGIKLSEIEDVLGIKVSEGEKSYDAYVPRINVESYSGSISINNPFYYTNNELIFFIGDSTYSRKLDNNAYRISYTASFFSEFDFDFQNKFYYDYTGALFNKNYTTAHNLEAHIFYYPSEFHALIYHDNIRYEIEMDVWDQPDSHIKTDEEMKLFEEYLDTLS